MGAKQFGALLVLAAAIIIAGLWVAGAQESAPAPSQDDLLYADPDSPVSGNPQGDVTVVEFFDYNCPYCRKLTPVLDELLRSDPGLRLVHKEFPVLGPGSEFAARAALAARRQDKYDVLHRALMQATAPLREAGVMAIARDSGLDLEKLRADMEDPAIQEAIERNYALARRLGIFATPGLVIGDSIIQGAADRGRLEELIQQARQGGAPAA